MVMHQKLHLPEHVRHMEPLLMGTFCSLLTLRQCMPCKTERDRELQKYCLKSEYCPHDVMKSLA